MTTPAVPRGVSWSGGYGVQRKVAGSEQGLDGMEKIAAMGLMGFGGLVAIIGGLIFLVIVLSVMVKGAQPAADERQEQGR